MAQKTVRPAMCTKAILFDIDGTVVDSNDHHISAWQEAFARHGQELDRQTIQEQISKGGDELVPSLLPQADPEMQEKIDAVHGEIFPSEAPAPA